MCNCNGNSYLYLQELKYSSRLHILHDKDSLEIRTTRGYCVAFDKNNIYMIIPNVCAEIFVHVTFVGINSYT